MIDILNLSQFIDFFSKIRDKIRNPFLHFVAKSLKFTDNCPDIRLCVEFSAFFKFLTFRPATSQRKFGFSDIVAKSEESCFSIAPTFFPFQIKCQFQNYVSVCLLFKPPNFNQCFRSNVCCFFVLERDQQSQPLWTIPNQESHVAKYHPIAVI